MKRMICLTACLFAVLTVAASPAVAAQKIGYVNLEKALKTSEAGKAAQEKIAAEFKDYEAVIEGRQEEIKTLKEELEKKAMLLSEEARSEKERDYQQKLKEYQRFTKDVQEDLQQRDADLTRGILEDLFEVIRNVGKEEGYSLILEKAESSILYADDQINLTDEVIKAYDAQYKKTQ